MNVFWIHGRLLKCLFASLLLGSASFLYAQQDQPLRIHQTVDISHPLTTPDQDKPPGFVAIIVHVDANGELLDALVTRYSHPAFADAAMRALQRWEYEAPRIDGEVVGIRQPLEISFQARGTVISQSVTAHLAERLERLQGIRIVDRVVPLSELDAPMEPIETVPPRPVPVSSEGHVVVDFYIDEEGHTRMPVIAEMDGEGMALAALEAIEQWRFPPPTHRGQPAVVRVKQKFIFSPAAGATE